MKDQIQKLESEERKIKNSSKSSNDSHIVYQKYPKLLIFLIIGFILSFFIIIFLLKYLFIIKKEKNVEDNKETTIKEEEEENKENNENNSIEASYYTMAGKEIQLINPDEVGLKDNDYYIKEIEFISADKTNLRNLKLLTINNGKYLPLTSGILSTKIILKNKLRTLDNLFKDNKDLIKINLGNLNMEEVISMKSTFSGCSNLTEINLDGVNSSNLIKMENTFENCTELKNVNLSPLNTSNLENMTNIFSGCEKLETIDLTSFKHVFNDSFNGIKSKPDIIANELISNEIKNIFQKLFSIDINIIINIFDIDKQGECKIGENEKCKTCSRKIKSNCLTCNEGFYLPYYELDNKVCLPCNIIEHCISCYGEKDYIFCSLCESGYELEENKCQKKVVKNCIIGEKEKCRECSHILKDQCESCNEGYFLPEDGQNKSKCEKCDLDGCLQCFGTKRKYICLKCKEGYNFKNGFCEEETCSIGENEKCVSCRTEIGRKKECLTCNEGYFLPEDEQNKNKCERCDLDECLQCSGTKDNKKCLKCKEGYNIKNGVCEEETCSIGENEKCASCRSEIGRKKECLTCNEGYYINTNEKSFKCVKCSIMNCNSCYFHLNKEYCQTCKENFEAIKNPKGLIENCTCPSGLKYFHGLCVEKGNWLELEINIYDASQKYQILSTLYTRIQSNEIDVFINNSFVPSEKLEFSSNYEAIFYKFEHNGFYILKINIKKILNTMEWMFTNQHGAKSIRFLPGFDSSKVSNMDDIFSCSSFESIDMKYLDTSNLLSIEYFLYGADGVRFLDVSNFDTSKISNMKAMFGYNYNLQELDLSSFDTSNVVDCIKMFHDLSPNCIIKISNQFTKCRELIPFDNKIINIDDITCKKFNNCEKGSKETLFCYKCKIGYQLIDNNCIKQKCELGENEKCLSCNNIIGKEDECLECNEGYTISNLLDKKICTKCEK